ncbi:MAG: hypothetical protein HY657_11695 [Acidobacteria bacterium]|nr:hypothetical protein [Acidobacteriota bacterium]
MMRRSRVTLRFALVVLVATVSGWTVMGQAPLPLRGQPPQPAQGGRGRGQAPAASNLPANPVVSPVAAVSAEVTGPGEMFPSLMALPAGDDLAHFRYETKEYVVSGTANGQPYRTRIVVRKPSDASRFSGLVLAESMHPSGNAWMFHFTHRYTMSSGHIGLEIVTSTPAPFVEFNGARYKDMKVEQGQASEIIAQVGALIRSARPGNPLAGLPLRKMVLAGTSASAGVLINYLPAHMVYRLPDMKPIYDGFLPTSNGANIRQIDVPMIQVPTTTEAMRGNVPTRQDGDAPGDQFRVYEFPGMPHLDTRDVAAFRPNPCKYPITMFPMSASMSVALHHLLEWIDKGTDPPRADRILVDRNTANDGSLMALDEFGNPRGGIRTPYVDVPVVRYGVPNEGAVPPTPNTVPWVALRGEAGINQLCGLTGYEIAMSPEQLRKLYTTKQGYVAKVRQRLDELTTQGWSLPVYREQILADAAKVNF